MILGLIASAIPFVGKILDKILPDPEQRAKAELEMMAIVRKGDSEELQAVASVIAAEARSSHWIVAAWRPILMLIFAAIIANNFIIAPYMGAMFGVGWGVALDIPPDMWQLLKIGVGGYIGGRSLEKAAAAWKGKG